jgi:hypothetical protein
VSDLDRANKPFWGKCEQCGHCWVVAYYPMEARRFASLLGNACCPKCAATDPLVAKQDGGQLLELVNPAGPLFSREVPA